MVGLVYTKRPEIFHRPHPHFQAQKTLIREQSFVKLN